MHSAPNKCNLLLFLLKDKQEDVKQKNQLRKQHICLFTLTVMGHWGIWWIGSCDMKQILQDEFLIEAVHGATNHNYTTIFPLEDKYIFQLCLLTISVYTSANLMSWTMDCQSILPYTLKNMLNALMANAEVPRSCDLEP